MFFCCVAELVPQAVRAAHHPPASQQHHRHLQICLHLPLQSQVNKLPPPSMMCSVSIIPCVKTIILTGLTFSDMPWVVLMVLWKHGQKTSSPWYCIYLKTIDVSLASFVPDPWVRIRILMLHGSGFGFCIQIRIKGKRPTKIIWSKLYLLKSWMLSLQGRRLLKFGSPQKSKNKWS